MKKIKKGCTTLFFLVILYMTSIWLFLFACAQTIVQKNGQLQVIGTQLCNQRNEPIQLKGMSYLDVSWFKDFVNTECFKWLRDDWGCTVIRAALYTVREDVFTFRALAVKDDMIKAVKAAIDTGLYVIIDWHIHYYSGNPMKYKNEALTFFTEMATLFKDTPNVLYEICNEPNGEEVTWQEVVKPYAEEVITTIRRIDPDNVILVGTPNWSQNVNLAADDPLAFDNIMYVCHFYSGSHAGDLRNKIDYALSKNAPIFVSEWGTTDDTLDGQLYPDETFIWIDFLSERKISWTNWSITIRNESSAVIKHIASAEGGWADADLTQSGLLVRSLIRGQRSSLVLFADSFETENFIAGGWDTTNPAIDRENASIGQISAVLKGKSTLTKSFSTQAFKNVKVQFTYKTENMKEGDSLLVEWFDGNSWQLLKKLDQSASWSKQTLALPEKAGDNYDLQFRFVSSFAGENTKAGLDEVSLILDRIQ